MIKNISLFQSSSDAFHCCFTVDKVIKMSITATCEACGKELKNGLCSFVGCHVGFNVKAKFVTRANFKIYDASEGAFLICDNPINVQRIMRWSIDDWTLIKSEAMKCGELLYLNSSQHSNESFKWFYEQCCFYPDYYLRQFRCICRQFKKQNNPSRNDSIRTFYCIDVYKDSEYDSTAECE